MAKTQKHLPNCQSRVVCRPTLNYCCFYFRLEGSVFDGQKNVSNPLRRQLELHFHLNNVSAGRERRVQNRSLKTFPKIGRILWTLHTILVSRIASGIVGKGGRETGTPTPVTIVDMMHSISVLPTAHFRDQLVLIGHDSYALYSIRALRDLRKTRLVRSVARKTVAFLAWSYAEFLLRRICSYQFFVASADRNFAGMDRRSGVVPIPLSASILSASKSSSPGGSGPLRKVLVPVPVLDPQQNEFDAHAIGTLLNVFCERIEIVVWGPGSEWIRRILEATPHVSFVTWADDYVAFLSDFDLVVYPRIIGSGFHTKLAEALALGVPCVCVDWIAEPLKNAGYTGIVAFQGRDDFSRTVKDLRDRFETGAPPVAGPVPDLAHAENAFRPVIEACVKLVAGCSL